MLHISALNPKHHVLILFVLVVLRTTSVKVIIVVVFVDDCFLFCLRGKIHGSNPNELLFWHFLRCTKSPESSKEN